jgi:hypothetical protein
MDGKSSREATCRIRRRPRNYILPPTGALDAKAPVRERHNLHPLDSDVDILDAVLPDLLS